MGNPWRTLLSLLTWSLGLGIVQAEPKRPPNYHYDHMPDTSFSCAGKVVGGYYADTDTECQMFHVCVQVDENDVRDFKFMCPNDTVFDQENFICANWFEIDCSISKQFYGKNLHLFQTLSDDLTKGGGIKTGSKIPGATLTFPEELSATQRKQVELQHQQLQDLEKQQNETNSKQQIVLDLHQRKQEEHQRKQLEILQIQTQQQQQFQLDQLRPHEAPLQGRKIASGAAASSQTVSMSTSSSSISMAGTNPAVPDTDSSPANDNLPVRAIGPELSAAGKKDSTTGQKESTDGTVEYDYYYYDYDESTEAQGNFFLNDEYDPNGAIVHASRGQLPMPVGASHGRPAANRPVHVSPSPNRVVNSPVHANPPPPRVTSTQRPDA